MSLRIYNTLTGQKEVFEPLKPNKVGMYVCGVTVYDYCHIGHARAAVVFDVIYRYLRYLGFPVHYARNFTDIDDKIINRANEENVPWTDITKKYIDAFYEDMGALNCLSPDMEPRATEYIGEMIALIEKLIENGKAYALKGDVYYAVKSFEPYGQLSGKNTEDLMSGARVEVDERKKSPLDFALWKSAKPGEPSWDSPWGQGRPGWHIECSAMGSKILGQQFDIHGGGKDLVFPHHENEIAQSHGAHGCPPVKYWVHNGFVNINKEKMSKSLGNFFSLRDLYGHYLPETLRYFLLTVHYRSPIDFSEQSLEEAGKVLSRFYDLLAAVEKLPEASHPIPEKNPAGKTDFLEKFEAAMDDDFNTALALGHMNDALRHLNKTLTETQIKQGKILNQAFARDFLALKKAAGVLGILIDDPKIFLEQTMQKKMDDMDLDVQKIEALIANRNAARKSKDWPKADACRDALTEMGVLLEDTPEGTLWKVK